MSNSTDADSIAFANAQIYREIAWLYGRSELHKSTPVAVLERMVLPAVLNGQYRLYRRGANPVAYVSWALMSEEVESRFVRAPLSLEPVEWRSGERIWFIDLVAPFGDAKWLLQEMRNNLSPDQVGRALRRYRSKKAMKIIYLQGRSALAKARDRELSPTVKLQA